MKQFDVYINTNPDSSPYIPYLLDVQSDLLDLLKTRVVVPLELCSVAKPAEILNPVFSIKGTMVMMSTAELAGVHIQHLGETVDSLAHERDKIIAALDMLFLGY